MTIKTKTIIIALLAAFFITTISGMALAQKKSNDGLLWKFATLAPDGSGWAKNMKAIVLPAIKDATEGKMKVKIYWGGVMGDEEDYIKKMHIGQLHGAGFSGQGATMLCPQMAVVELPFLFNNYAEVDYIKEKMEAAFDALLKENGYFLVSWNDQDFDQILSNGRAITKLEDFAKTKFVTWYGPLEVNLIETLKANPIALNVPEVAVGARTSTFELAIGPSMFVVGAQLHNSIKHINPCKIRYSPSLIVVSNETWAKLPKKYADAYHHLRLNIMKEYDENVRIDNARALTALFKYGIEKNEFSPEEFAKVRAATRVVWDNMADQLYPAEVLEELLEHLEDFRKANPASS